MFLSDRLLSLVVIDLFEEKEADEDIEQGKGDQDSPVLQDVFGREGIFCSWEAVSCPTLWLTSSMESTR